jgi:hypothetical protein
MVFSAFFAFGGGGRSIDKLLDNTPTWVQVGVVVIIIAYIFWYCRRGKSDE